MSTINTTNLPVDVIPRDLRKLEGQTDNIYEALAVISKRANQLSVAQKEEITSKMLEYMANNDNLEEVFENREQIELSTKYEKMPKSTIIATEEFTQGKIYFRNPVTNPLKED